MPQLRTIRAPKPKGKKVSFELIVRDSVIGHPMYALLDELVDLFHQELRKARIALAWCTSWNPDVDGRVTLGKCMKASDLHREMAPYDFVILLRKSFWRDERVTAHQRRALLDHELCHAAVKYDGRGEPVIDERERPVFRMRKHDIEEFTAIVERYGCYKNDLEQFAAALRRADAKFNGCELCRESPGWVSVPDAKGGTPHVTRCVCYVQWAERREISA